MSIRDAYCAHYLSSRLLHWGVGALCAFSGAVSAEEGLPTGFSLWGVGGTQSVSTFSSEGQGLLRPPASWSWDALPQLDAAAGVGHRFRGGLNIDLGLSLSHSVEADAINYRDYFLGLSYGSLEGKFWYLPDAGDNDSTSMYYEAGWNQPVNDRLSVSLRLGQQYRMGSSLITQDSRLTNLSIGASTRMGQYGLGLRFIDNGGRMFGGEDDFRLMGSIFRSLP